MTKYFIEPMTEVDFKIADQRRLELSRSTERDDLFEEGQHKKAIEIARKLLLLNSVTLEDISNITGISVSDLKNMQ